MAGFLKYIGAIGFVLALGLFLYRNNPPNPVPPPTATATTKLMIEISGGFAYVPTPSQNKLEIAYLNDVKFQEDTDRDGDVDASDQVVCDVDQIGTQLIVVRGKIIDSDPKPAPPNRIFDLDGAVVTFPQLEGATSAVAVGRTPFPPSPLKPANASVESEWQDLQFVPSIKDHHPGTSIDPSWQGKVNGRLILKGGRIVGTFPSDPMIQQTSLEYKLAGVSKGLVGTTDKTIYTTEVADNKIEIVFNTSALNFKKVVIEPLSPGEPVRLRLRGLHSHGSAATLANGDELKDFCSFYSLLQPRPKSEDWLRVHYVAPASTPGPGVGQPSPGYFCTGDWF